MDASGVVSLTQDDDVRHDTRDGDHDDTFSLLDRLLEDLPEIVDRFVLPALDPTALALLARVRRGWHAVVVSSGLPCAGITEGAPLRVREFCGMSTDSRGQKQTAARGTSGRVLWPLGAGGLRC